MARLDRGLARLDLGRLRFLDLSADHAADRAELSRAADSGDGGVHDHVVDAARRRHRGGLALRPRRTEMAADDLDRLVFAVQSDRRPRPELLAAVPVSRAARRRHGRGMAMRRGPGDGAVAATLARIHGFRPAILVGPRGIVVERGLWSAL